MLNTTTIDDFKLNWRWTDPKYCLMPSEDLALILPLSAESAKKVWEKSLTFVSKDNNFSPEPDKFKDVCSIESENEVKVATWLRNKISSSKVIVSWDKDLAVVTNTEIFIRGSPAQVVTRYNTGHKNQKSIKE